MPNFWRVLDKVIADADVIVEVLDSRSVSETRNREIEDKVLRSGKKLVLAMNKCDLVSKEKLEQYKKELENAVFVSAKDRHGTAILKDAILKIAGYPKSLNIGIVGYPNTGKSSLINSLVGRSRARSSPESGFTKGMQKIRLSSRITLIDTPGVIPYMEKDELKHGTIGSVDHSKVKDPESVFLDIFTKHKDAITRHYGTDAEDYDDFLEAIAGRFNYLKKGAEGDTTRAARKILKDWQSGKIIVD
ncbi:MAG: GTPase [Candidatus Woesearchaeota archaeon]